MRLIGKATALHIYIGEADIFEGVPLHEAILVRARELGIAGVTVFRGMSGYGAHRSVHRHSALALWSDDPILVSVIESPANVELLVKAIDGMVTAGCLLTMHEVTAIQYATHSDIVAHAGTRK